jgi:hypothetical protein
MFLHHVSVAAKRKLFATTVRCVHAAQGLFFKKSDKGFTLLLAALISAIVLSLGAAIFSIAQKQIILSGLGRDSQFAFYAADTLAECALYWEFRFSYFASSSPAGVTPTCDGQRLDPITEAAGQSAPYGYPYTLVSQPVDVFQDTTPGNFCAQVSVAKSIDPSTGAVVTIIHADGYSVSCASIDTSDRALQRSVEFQY